MSFFASVAGFQIVAGQLMIPLSGPWTADVHLATDSAVTGKVAVVVGNLTLQGFVYRSQAYGGQTRARLVGGAGGWRTTIPEQGYGSGSGVRLSHVAQDAATACGETVSVPNDVSLGPAYARIEGPASDVLWSLVAQGFAASWYVDPDGVTQLAAWPSTTVATPFTVTDQAPDEGRITIATEDYASWMPGCSFTNPLISGTFVNGGVNYVWTDDGQFRFEVLTGTTDRLLGALRAIIDSRVAGLRFYGRYEYRISNPSATTIDASPVDSTRGLPDLQNVPIVSDSIATYVPPVGGLCRIQFVNGTQTRPECVWTQGTAKQAAIAGGASALTVAPWSEALSATLVGLASALSNCGTPPPPSAVVLAATLVAAGGALATSLGALPPPATTETTAT